MRVEKIKLRNQNLSLSLCKKKHSSVFMAGLPSLVLFITQEIQGEGRCEKIRGLSGEDNRE